MLLILIIVNEQYKHLKKKEPFIDIGIIYWLIV